MSVNRVKFKTKHQTNSENHTSIQIINGLRFDENKKKKINSMFLLSVLLRKTKTI